VEKEKRTNSPSVINRKLIQWKGRGSSYLWGEKRKKGGRKKTTSLTNAERGVGKDEKE